MCIDLFTAALSSAASVGWQFLNSNIAIAFVGGLTGAIGGALGAQHIVERSKRRDELMKELRNTNAAIMVTFSICNSALALKKQHVQPLHQEFDKARADLQAFKAQRSAGQQPPNAEYHFVADFKTFPAPTAPIETLKDIVYSKVSAYGRPLALVAVLEQSLVGLRDAIAKRDALIQRFASGAIPPELTPQYYFGLPLPGGDTNQEYPDTVEAIHSYTDDVAFFCALLCEDLVTHGNEVRSVYLKKFKKGAPRISTADFSGPREKELVPPDSQYKDWLNSFAKYESSKEENEKKT